MNKLSKNTSAAHTRQNKLNRPSLNFLRLKGAIILLTVLFLSPFAASAQFSGGNGTEDNPYVINNESDIISLAMYINNMQGPYASAHYILKKDIDLYYINYSEGGWIPIGNTSSITFNGVFNGNDYKLKNLNISNSDQNSIGLFGYIGTTGIVKNVCLENVNISVTISNNINQLSTGGIAGVNKGAISNCYTTGTINVNFNADDTNPLFMDTGGIVGSDTGNILNCYSACSVSAIGRNKGDISLQTGGLIGYHAENTVSNCYSTGTVFSSSYSSTSSDAYSHTGGIVGKSGISGKILNCYTTSIVDDISENTYKGGVAGLITEAAQVLHCAALNPKLTGSGDDFRVVGYNDGNLSNNIAFDKMLNSQGEAIWNNIGHNDNDGENITREEINADGTLGGRFTTENGWTIQNGKLPGLFDSAIDIPGHLLIINFDEGDGSAQYPFIIKTPLQLAQLATVVNSNNINYNDKHYKLGNDINLSDYHTGEGWIPIGYDSPFKGLFDGNDKIISELYINSSKSTGLFGAMNGTVKNLGVENININITTNDYNIYVGGLAGIVQSEGMGEKISYCYTTGVISITSTSLVSLVNAGGVAGSIELGATISNCYSTCDINVSSYNAYEGGIVGFSMNGTVIRCYSTGMITAKCNNISSSIGGIVGKNEFGNISNCIALNPRLLYSDENKCNYGRIWGDMDGDASISSNYAFEKMINPDGTNIWSYVGQNFKNGANISSATINQDGTLGDFFSDYYDWTTENGRLPGLFGKTVEMPLHLQSHNGTSSDPFLIYTAEQLGQLSIYVNSDLPPFSNANVHYKLCNDINLSDYNSGNWFPIGLSRGFSSFNDPSPFKGVFDGNGKIISGLNVSKVYDNEDNYEDNLYCSGLFGYISEGTVKNLGVENAIINNGLYSGVIAGYSEGSIINCYSTGSLSNIFPSDLVYKNCTVGGIVGYNFGSLGNCYSNCTITITNGGYETFAGGLVGENNQVSVISNCYSTGTVRNESHELAYTGGIVGRNSGGIVSNCAALNSSLISKSYNNYFGRITGNNSYSSNEGTLTNNIGFIGMIHPTENGLWSNIGLTNIDGANISKEVINSDATLGNRFTSENGWTTQNGKLPGLFDNAVEMPVHLLFINFEGNGSENNPYIITTAEQLAQLAKVINAGSKEYNGKYYKLGNDIDLSDYGASYNSGNGWIPIGNGTYRFSGGFDGNEKIISGLYINSSNLIYSGLFGSITSAAIKNLGVENINVNISTKGFIYVGGISANVGTNGNITNCFTSGIIKTLSTSSVSVGGIAGSCVNGIISNCYSTCTIEADCNSANAGGIVGILGNGSGDAGNVLKCYSTGMVIAKCNYESNVGGIAGYCFGNISNCVALNPKLNNTGITATFGRICGIVANVGVLSSNSAYDNMLTPNDNILWENIGEDKIDGANISKTEINENGSLGGRFTLENGWTTKNGKLPGLFGNTVEMPAHLIIINFEGNGSENNPYIIKTAEQLAQLAKVVNAENNDYNDKHYILGNDIDLSDLGEDFNSGEGWIPIGYNYDNPFRGHFDGNNNVITNLYINSTNCQNAGLFGALVTGATIKNLGVVNVDVNINITIVGNGFAGGIVARNIGGKVISSFSTGSISATSHNSSAYAGGVVGENSSFAGISKCYSTCNVYSNSPNSSSLSPYAYTGGIVGNNSTLCIVDNCYSSGTINAISEGYSTAGGIVGNNGGNIYNCYSICLVSGTGNGFSYTGGIAATNYNGEIKDCAALNSSIFCTGKSKYFGRVVGRYLGENMQNVHDNNIAFNNMLNPDGDTTWENIGVKDIDGEDITKIEINTDGSLGDRFKTTENGWTVENRKLPGLFGNTVEIPEYLKLCFLTIEIDPAGAGTVEGAGIYNVNDNVTVKALPKTGYNFINWTKGGTVVEEDNEYYFVISDDVDLSANFKIRTYTVAVSSNNNEWGTVSGGNEDIEHGTNITVTATPNTGYEFINWQIVGGSNVSDKEEYTFTVMEDVNLVANFKPEGKFWVTLNVNPAGAGIVTGSGFYDTGASVKITAQPNTGYNFVNWTDEENSPFWNGLEYTFNIYKDEEFTANFIPIKYTISASVNIEGGSVSGAGEYNYGETATLTATATQGFVFMYWTDSYDGSLISTNRTYIFVVKKDESLIANFRGANDVILSISINPAGAGTATGAGVYSTETEVTINAIPNEGSDFVSWTSGTNVISNNSEHTFTITQNTFLTANFMLNAGRVTVVAAEGGSVEIVGYNKLSELIELGTSVTVKAIPDEDWNFYRWTNNNGDAVSDNEEYTFVVSEDITLTAKFRPKNKFEVILKVNPTEAGKVSGDGFFTANSSVTVTAEANDGYKFLHWRKENNQVVTSSQSYTFTIIEDITLTAYFEPIKYTVSLSVNIENGGTVEGDGAYNYGSQITVKAIPNAELDYVFLYWINSENGSVVSTAPNYTFTVLENKNWIANFKKKDKFLLSITVVPEDAGTIEGAGEYKENVEVTVKAIPKAGYTFKNWTNDDVSVSENEIYSFTISEDIILIANFKSIGDGEATLSNIEISGGRLSPPLSSDIFSYRLLFDCKQNNISVEFTPLGSAFVKIDDLELENGIKDFEMKNAGTIPVTVSVINGVYISDYTFELVRPFDNAITPLWNDVLSVINNPAINGGYNFTEFQWYSDLLLLEPIVNATNGYITIEDNKNANYNVWLKGSKEGAEFSSFGCRYEVVDKSVTLRVYPNPTSDKITVEVENSPAEFIMELNDIQGITVMKKIITQPVFEINMKEFPKGIYILTVEGKTVRIINN